MENYRTERRRIRAQRILIAVVSLLALFALWVSTRPARAAEEEDTMRIRYDCGRVTCVIPKEDFLAILKNEAVRQQELDRLAEAAKGCVPMQGKKKA